MVFSVLFYWYTKYKNMQNSYDMITLVVHCIE